MNYIKHLSGFFNKVSKDDRLNPTHVSLYVSLFQFWNACRFHNPISISRNEVMRVSKISSKATYHKCIRELNDFGYLSYQPSYNPFKGSLVYLFDFQASSEPLKNKSRVKTETSSEQAVVSYTNNSNNTKHQTIANENPRPEVNSVLLQGQKNKSNEKNDDSENGSPKPSGEKKEMRQAFADTKEKNSGVGQKLREKKKADAKGQARPLFEQVQNYFAEKNYPPIEAEKFYNHYESNGWLVSGKTPMINWHASAANWMLNSEHFNNVKKLPSPSEKGGGMRLHTSNDKNYAEPL